MRCVENPEADPRWVNSVNNECGCVERMPHDTQVPRKTVTKGSFCIRELERRKLRRANFVSSTFGLKPIDQSNQFGGDEAMHASSPNNLHYGAVDDDDRNEGTTMLVPKDTDQIYFSLKETQPLSKKPNRRLVTCHLML